MISIRSFILIDASSQNVGHGALDQARIHILSQFFWLCALGVMNCALMFVKSSPSFIKTSAEKSTELTFGICILDLFARRKYKRIEVVDL
ncbi:hypothetical protein WJ31_28180 [Burkholderia ubonensis]|nr:hypothetical protein WJ31_28180 [Burkholderia ubonensis]KWI39220.1 hypothetical protein WM05_29845 [Burkholderia ubonensis]OJA39315.1 hypothetical protein BGV47_12120 [Burkholderia ubonensis]OJA52180.1 hypothetical protein BGV69_28145 [Burkholderia ubonensis]OJB23687.1 hypothetical protein BGV55_23410 [Burkholderia ubonensis]